MYSYQERVRAVELYLQLGARSKATPQDAAALREVAQRAG